MADEERIELALDLGRSSADVIDLEGDLKKLDAELQRTAKSGAQLEHELDALERELGLTAVAAAKEAKEQRDLDAALDAQVAAAMNATMAQKAMAQVLSESHGNIVSTTAAFTGLRGTKGINGQGLLGASYALQDFVTVISMGGGFGRAMMSAANNITPVAGALGLGAGVAGGVGLAVTAMSAAIPVIENFFRGFSDDTAKAAAKELDEIASKVKGVQDALDKLRGAPTEAEKGSAAALKSLLEERGMTQKVQGTVAGAMGEEEAMTARGVAGVAGALPTDIQLEQQANRAATNMEGELNQAAARMILARLQKERAQERARLMNQARQQRAGEIIAGAIEAGPAGQPSRDELARLTRGTGLGEAIAGTTPEALARQQEEADREIAEDAERAERLHTAGQRRRRAATAKARRRELIERQIQRDTERKFAESTEQARRESQVARGFDQEVSQDVQRSIQLNRALGRAAEHQARPKIDTGMIPLLPLNPSDQQVIQATVRNQQQLTNTVQGVQATQEELNRALRQVQRRNAHLRHEARGTVQQGQSAMNMGAPF